MTSVAHYVLVFGLVFGILKMFQIKVVDDTEITRDTIYRMPSETFFRKSVEFHEE